VRKSSVVFLSSPSSERFSVVDAAFYPPYILCFHQAFVEIRLVHDGSLVQLISEEVKLLSSNDDTNPYSPMVVSRRTLDGLTVISFLDMKE